MMKTQIAGWVVALCALMLTNPLLAQSSSGTSSVFMTIVGPDGPLQGEVMQKGREGSHRLQAFSHEVVSPRDPATGLPTGKRQHTPFRVVKLINKSSPSLLDAMTKNATLPNVEISIWSPSGVGTEEKVLTYKLVDASVASLRPWMPNKNDPSTTSYPPAEELSFTYKSIVVTFQNGGIVATDEWSAALP